MTAALVIAALVVSGLMFAVGRPGDVHVDKVLDTDGDGISNAAEESGWRTRDNGIFVTDPNDPDDDGDGLSDGQEAGALVSDARFGKAYLGLSSPHVSDTDRDGVGDADEYFLDMDPQSPDSDSDGLLDKVELRFESDPTLANPDDDSYLDNEEYERGSDPLDYTLTPGETADAAKAGAKYGDCAECARGNGLRDEQIQSVAYLVGHAASGVAGYGDFRDLGVNMWKRDLAAAGFSAVGLVPGYGDSVKNVAMLTTFAKRGEPAARAARRFVEQLPVSAARKNQILDRIFGDAKRLPARLDGGPKNCLVYVGRSQTGSISYVGITNNISRRQAQHGGRFTIGPVQGASGLSRGACRAVEEALMKRLRLTASGGVLQNKNHSISPQSDDYDEAVEYGKSLLVGFRLTGP